MINLVQFRMSLTLRTIAKLLIAIALIVVPFSMTHASMSDVTSKSEVVHMKHNHEHTNHDAELEMDQSSANHSTHKEHENANCCSSICGGALTVDEHRTNCLTFSKLIRFPNSKSMELGEWVPPFRPPST